MIDDLGLMNGEFCVFILQSTIVNLERCCKILSKGIFVKYKFFIKLIDKRIDEKSKTNTKDFI